MKKLLTFVAGLAVALALQANPEGYFMLSVISPGQLPTPESDLYGLRLSLIYGDCQNLNGVDVGLSGRVRERTNGLQVNALFSADDAELNGVGIGCVNYAGSEFAGLQVGLWNHAASGAGMQCGLVNTAAAFDGFQLGLLNFADNLNGVQVGLSNYAGNAACAWLPIVNVAW